jgi:hypothetical protein
MPYGVTIVENASGENADAGGTGGVAPGTAVPGIQAGPDEHFDGGGYHHAFHYAMTRARACARGNIAGSAGNGSGTPGPEVQLDLAGGGCARVRAGARGGREMPASSTATKSCLRRQRMPGGGMSATPRASWRGDTRRNPSCGGQQRHSKLLRQQHEDKQRPAEVQRECHGS